MALFRQLRYGTYSYFASCPMEPIQTEKKAKFLDPKANLKGLLRIAAGIAAIIIGIWLFVRFTAGEKAANKTAAVILRRPIDLNNSVENVPASSFKAFGLSLPY